MSGVSIATSVPCFLLPVHPHTLCLHHSISISSVVLYCKWNWVFSRWARDCCDPWPSLLLEGLHRCVTSSAALLSSLHTKQSLRRSPLVEHLAEKDVLTSDAPVLECSHSQRMALVCRLFGKICHYKHHYYCKNWYRNHRWIIDSQIRFILNNCNIKIFIQGNLAFNITYPIKYSIFKWVCVISTIIMYICKMRFWVCSTNILHL